jgi:hypothetical protein
MSGVASTVDDRAHLADFQTATFTVAVRSACTVIEGNLLSLEAVVGKGERVGTDG